MKVLVTGASGFTGGSLARFLAQQGDAVRGLVRRRDRAGILAGLSSLEMVEGDLKDRDSLRRAVAGVDVVYNIAALYREAGLPAAEYRAVNATAVGTIVELAQAAGVRRVVHCSTVGVHGDIRTPPAHEDAPLAPGDLYQETKLEGERAGREAAARVGMELVIARPTGIYGPGDRRLFKIFGKIAARRFVMLGPGTHFYHLTYIDDLCAGFRLCATVPAAAGRTYILGGGEVTTLRELVGRTAEVAGVPAPRWRLPVWPFWVAGAACEAIFTPFGMSPPIYRRRVDFFRKSRAFDIGRARRELGFNPSVGLRDGLRRTLEWYVSKVGSEADAHRDIARAQEQLFRQPGGARAKYSALIIGRPGWGALLKYEFVVLLAQTVPGALGLALRKACYPWLLGRCGRNVVFGQNVVLRHPHKIEIADNVVIDDHCLLDAKGESNHGIRIGSGVFVGRNTILSCKNGDIELADGANVGFNCEIFSASRVRVGRDTLIAAYTYLVGGDHDVADRSRPVIEQGRRSAGIEVGDGAWIGSGVTVLDGVTLGDRTVVGAGAVVRESVPAGVTVAGVPARPVGARPETG